MLLHAPGYDIVDDGVDLNRSDRRSAKIKRFQNLATRSRANNQDLRVLLANVGKSCRLVFGRVSEVIANAHAQICHGSPRRSGINNYGETGIWSSLFLHCRRFVDIDAREGVPSCVDRFVSNRLQGMMLARIYSDRKLLLG